MTGYPERRGGSLDRVAALFAVVTVLLLGVAGVIWMQGEQPGREPRAQAPLITAPAEPFKTRYDGPQDATEPPPEREIHREMAQTGAGKGAAPKASPAADSIVEGGPKTEPPPVVADNSVAKAAPKPTATAPAKAEAAPPPFLARGSFVAQLGAFLTPTAAREAFGRVSSAQGSLMSGANLDVQRHEDDDGRILHRLRVGYFQDRTRAESFCVSMRAAGQPCLVAPR